MTYVFGKDVGSYGPEWTLTPLPEVDRAVLARRQANIDREYAFERLWGSPWAKAEFARAIAVFEPRIETVYIFEGMSWRSETRWVPPREPFVSTVTLD